MIRELRALRTPGTRRTDRTRGTRRIRRTLAAVLCVVAATAMLGAAPSSAAPGHTAGPTTHAHPLTAYCRLDTCTGLDPQAEGCMTGSQQRAGFDGANLSLAVFYSPACDAGYVAVGVTAVNPVEPSSVEVFYAPQYGGPESPMQILYGDTSSAWRSGLIPWDEAIKACYTNDTSYFGSVPADPAAAGTEGTATLSGSVVVNGCTQWT